MGVQEDKTMTITFYKKDYMFPPSFNMFLYPDPEERARAEAEHEKEYAEAVAKAKTLFGEEDWLLSAKIAGLFID
jgi:hypothetical protein